MRPETLEPRHQDVGLAATVGFLSDVGAYAHRPDAVTCRETHMSLVFIAGDLVFKLKKPVRFPYLDFSTVERRGAACRAELAINRRLAPEVYREVVPLVSGPTGMTIGGEGEIVDWVVVMRRLSEDRMLDRAILANRVTVREIDGLADRLADFYRHTRRVFVAPDAQLAEWRRQLALSRRILSNARFRLDSRKFAAIDRAERRFLDECRSMLIGRVLKRRIIDGHGDLRPEHVSLAEPMAIIDRLEFDPRLRVCDPFDEIASFTVECDRLGVIWIGERLTARIARLLGDSVSPELFAFYRSYRATLRARLTIAHLLDPDCRTPEKWPPLAEQYLDLAAEDARTIDAIASARRRRRVGQCSP